MERIISVLTVGPICCRNRCSLWQTLVKICTNRASICEYKIAHLSFFCDHAEQSRSMSLEWFDEWICHFYDDFCFVLAFVVFVFAWANARNARWPGSGLCNRNVSFPSLDTQNVRNFKPEVLLNGKRQKTFMALAPQSTIQKNRLRTKVSYFFPNLFKLFYLQ